MNKECLIQKGLELMSTDIEKYLCQTCVKSAKFNPGNHKKTPELRHFATPGYLKGRIKYYLILSKIKGGGSDDSNSMSRFY